MRTFLIGVAAASLMAGAALAQTPHEVAPGSDQIAAPTPSTDRDSAAAPSALPASPGLQSGIAGIAAGSNDYPRATPDPGSTAGVTSSANSATRAANQFGSDVSATARDYPLSWNGTQADWDAHAKACAARYRSYNAGTDEFQLRRGVKAMCPARYK